MSILPADPKAGYLAHREAIDAAIRRVLDRGWYILGPEVEAFEAEFAQFLGAGHAVGVGNGTDALFLALKACGIGSGDRVVTVSHTAVATVAAIEAAGAVPVFADADPSTRNMDPASLEAVLQKTDGVKAAIPVHLYGRPADLPRIMDLAKQRGLFVIEDCAQAHGAMLNGRRVGTWGDLGTFSFYPTKNLGAFGDGGAVATSNPELAERVKLLREYGWKERYVSREPGFNSRLDELQAAILRERLVHLDEDNAKRRSLAAIYSSRLKGSGFALPDADGVFHLYVIETDDRDRIRAALRERGVGTGIHYPVPVHLQPAYRGRVPLVVPLPHTEAAANRVLSLPLYPELDPSAVHAVCDHLLAVRGRA